MEALASSWLIIAVIGQGGPGTAGTETPKSKSAGPSSMPDILPRILLGTSRLPPQPVPTLRMDI